jgi:tetratricopeptide (TPR) repeat protein
MKLKLYFTAIMLLGMMGVSNAQAQNPECMTNLSIFSEHAKVKNYDAAYEPWKMVYEACPQLNNAIYVYGERILKDKIDKASGAEKEGFVNDLMGLYDNKLEHFASKTSPGETMVDKAMVKYDNKMADDAAMYSMLSEAFTKDRGNFKNPKALYIYFSSLVDLHNAGSKDLQEVFEVYDEVLAKIDEENTKLTDQIAKLLPKEDAGTLTSKEKRRLRSYNSYSEAYGKIEGSIDSKLGALADCDNLIPLYQKNFESKKSDLKWVKSAVGRMFSKECTDDPLFKEMVEVQAELDPSADVYVYLGTLKSKSGDTNGAVSDFNKALELETDARKKSNIAYKVATIYRNGSKSTARSYAQKAIDANPANGRAYLLIASLYANSANQCGNTTFEKRAIYWKAADMARKAGRVDPSLSGRASQSAVSYEAKAPTKEMIFTEGMAGKSVSFSCWVGGSVTVPNL